MVPLQIPVPSLLELCLRTVVTHLERYPPQAFAICSPEDWEAVVQLRYEKTIPKRECSTAATASVNHHHNNHHQQQQQQHHHHHHSDAANGAGSNAAGGGGGGLDGTGRMLPAISEKAILAVEEANPHLKGTSELVDRLIWKDCVEYRFRCGSLARPRAFLYPWPVLVERVQKAASELLDYCNNSAVHVNNSNTRNSNNNTNNNASPATGMSLSSSLKMLWEPRAFHILHEIPMNVSLLQATGVGKTVRKIVKALKQRQQQQQQQQQILGCGPVVFDELNLRLESLLNQWKDLAARTGVSMGTTTTNATSHTKPAPGTAATATAATAAAGAPTFDEEQEDMQVLESSCATWRDLFMVLKQREETRRSDQGKRMREIRKNLASGRPKVVKVRPTNIKHERILDRPSERNKPSFASVTGSSPSSNNNNNSRLVQIRKETAVATMRSKASLSKATSSSVNGKGSFGAAVAFAATGSKKTGSGGKAAAATTATTARTVVSLAGGKRMNVPTSIVEGGAAGPRQLASKWKMIKKK